MASSGFTRINQRQRAYLEQVVAGKSKREAKAIAGYSENSNVSRIETPSMKAAFSRLVRHHVPAHVLAKRIAEGLNAEETKFFQFEGKITDHANVVAWGERRQYAELAAEWGGYVEKEKTAGDTNVAFGFTLINGITSRKKEE